MGTIESFSDSELEAELAKRKRQRWRSPKEFSVTFTCSITMHECEIWPDRDGPPNPTAQDVKDSILDYGPVRALEDWNMWTAGSSTVDVVEK